MVHSPLNKKGIRAQTLVGYSNIVLEGKCFVLHSLYKDVVTMPG